MGPLRCRASPSACSAISRRSDPAGRRSTIVARARRSTALPRLTHALITVTAPRFERACGFAPKMHVVTGIRRQQRPPLPHERDAPVRGAAAHPLDPLERHVHRLLQQLPADGQLPGHRPRHPARPQRPQRARSAVRAAAARGRRGSSCRLPAQRPGQDRPTSSSSASPRASAADINFLVLPLVVALVTGLHGDARPAARAAAQEHAAARGVRDRHLRLARRHRRRSRSCPPPGTDPLVWFSVAVVLVLLLELGRPLTIWPRVGRGRRSSPARPRHQRPARASWASATSGRRTTASPPTRTRAGIERRSTSTASRTRRSIRSTEPQEPFYDQVYNWFPGRTYQNVLIVGAGSGSDVADRAGPRRRPRRRGRDRSRASSRSASTTTPTSRTRTRASRAYINDGRAFLRTHRQEVRPDRLRPARLADARQHARRTCGSSRSCSPSRRSRASATTSRPTASSCSTTTTARTGWSRSSPACSRTRSARRRSSAPTTNAQAALADGPAVAALPNGAAARRPRRRDPGPAGDPAPTPATDDWPFLYLRTPFVADYYLDALAIVLRRSR